MGNGKLHRYQTQTTKGHGSKRCVSDLSHACIFVILIKATVLRGDTMSAPIFAYTYYDGHQQDAQ